MIATETNPITGKKGKRYQVNGKKVYEKFLIVTLNGRTCVISSIGRLWLRREFDNVYDEVKPGTSRGCYVVNIHNSSECIRKKYSMHRIVATYFLPKTTTDIKRERNIVHIKNGEKTNITPENLMWVNQKEMNRITLFNKQIGLISKLGKVNIDDVINSKYVALFLLDKDKYTIPEIIKILQLEKWDGIKEALTKKRKVLKR